MGQEIIRIDLKGVNCYLGKSEEGFVLFDTGGHLTLDKEYSDRYELLKEELIKAGCTVGKLKAIILTHGDFDHTGNAAKLRNEYGTMVAMHEKDIVLVHNINLDYLMRTYHYRSLIYKLIFAVMRKPIKRLTEKVLRDFESFLPDRLLQEGDDLSEYGFDAKIIHLPGHTEGSIGILTKDGQLIGGDIFTNRKVPAPAPNAYSFKQMYASINKLRKLHPSTIYPGHGEPFKTGNLKGFA